MWLKARGRSGASAWLRRIATAERLGPCDGDAGSARVARLNPSLGNDAGSGHGFDGEEGDNS